LPVESTFWPPITACERQMMVPWLSTAWRLGGVIGLERTSRPARMANADTIN